MKNEYVEEMKMLGEYPTGTIHLSKEESKVIIPYEEYLTKSQIITSLSKSDLSFSYFEEYLDHLRVVKEMTTEIIDKSKK